MKSKCIAAVMLVTATAALSWGADGAALYKRKCAGCHGASGEGKPGMKTPALKGTSMDGDQIVQKLTKGDANSKAPHNKGIPHLSEDEARAVADYIKALQ